MTDRKTVLLNACLQLLRKQEDSSYTLDLLKESVCYDEAKYNGHQLIEDIEEELTKNSSSQNLFNQYIIKFKNNPPAIIWAKDYEIVVKDGVEQIKLIDTHKDYKIGYINLSEVLYITTARCNVAL